MERRERGSHLPIWIALFLLVPLVAPAQRSPLDSLTFALSQARTDTDSLRCYVELSTSELGDAQASMVRRGLALVDRCLTDHPDARRRLISHKARLLSEIGVVLRHTGHVDSAKACYDLGFALAEEAGDRRTQASILNGLGVYHYIAGNIPEAIRSLEQSIELKEASGDTERMAAVLSNLASMYVYRGDLATAMALYHRGLTTAEEMEDHESTQAILMGLAALYESQHEWQEALDRYEEAFTLADSLGYANNTPIILNNMATVLKARGDMAGARARCEEGVQRAVTYQQTHSLPVLYFKLSDILSDLGDLPAAISATQASLAYADSIGSNVDRAFAHEQLGRLKLLLGDHEVALAHALEARRMSQTVEDLALRRDVAHLLAGVYESMGRAAPALAAYREFQQLKDSLANDENQRLLTRSGFKYEYEKKEALLQAEQDKKNALAAEELRRQKLMRNGFMGGFALVALFAGVFFVQRNRISKARKRSDELLLNILPEEVAEELKDTGAAQAKQFDGATILFSDFKGFTQASEKLSPQELVEELHTCFKAFDHLTEARGIEKIKTIGDAYMCAGGLPDPMSSSPADVVHAALEMQDFMKQRKAERDAQGKPAFEMRVGIHTGPVVAGIVGLKKFQYDIWGDTVNTASRMESSGEVGQVNISEATYRLVNGEGSLANGEDGDDAPHAPVTNSHSPAFIFTPRGKVKAKGKGEMEMYFVERA